VAFRELGTQHRYAEPKCTQTLTLSLRPSVLLTIYEEIKIALPAFVVFFSYFPTTIFFFNFLY